MSVRSFVWSFLSVVSLDQNCLVTRTEKKQKQIHLPRPDSKLVNPGRRILYPDRGASFGKPFNWQGGKPESALIFLEVYY